MNPAAPNIRKNGYIRSSFLKIASYGLLAGWAFLSGPGQQALAATANVDLAWDAQADATGFKLYRATTSLLGSTTTTAQSISVIQTIASASAVSCTSTNLTVGTTYYFRLSAYNSYGESGFNLDAGGADEEVVYTAVANTPTFTATATRTATPVLSATSTATRTATRTATPVLSATSTATRTASRTASPTRTQTPVLSATPTFTPSPIVTATSVVTAAPSQTAVPGTPVPTMPTSVATVGEGKVKVYPNPVRQTSFMIQFHAPEAGKAEISLFNIAGRRVAQIQTTLANPGEQSVPYTVEKLANGVYFVTVKVEGRTLGTSRLVLQR